MYVMLRLAPRLSLDIFTNSLQCGICYLVSGVLVRRVLVLLYEY